MFRKESQEDFVKSFYEEKKSLIQRYFAKGPDEFGQRAQVAQWIEELGLDEQENGKLRTILDAVVTDVMYMTLLALDGDASIGGRQESYRLFDESGNELTSSGMIEAFAYEYFHGSKKA